MDTKEIELFALHIIGMAKILFDLNDDNNIVDTAMRLLLLVEAEFIDGNDTVELTKYIKQNIS